MAITHRWTSKTARQEIMRFYSDFVTEKHAQAIMDNSLSEEDYYEKVRVLWDRAQEGMKRCRIRKNLGILEYIVADTIMAIRNEANIDL